jgi:hypothetical protein
LLEAILNDPESNSFNKSGAIQSLALVDRRMRSGSAKINHYHSLSKYAWNIDFAKRGGRTKGATAAVERLLTAYWTEPELRESAFLALLGYQYLHPLPLDLVDEIDAIASACPELAALSEGSGFFLAALAGQGQHPVQ